MKKYIDIFIFTKNVIKTYFSRFMSINCYAMYFVPGLTVASV